METSPNWNVEIVPGAKRVKRMVAAIVNLSMLPPESDLSLSEHVRRPGEIGSVVAEPTLS